MADDQDPTAGQDELAIFIDSEGHYRILVPHAWSLAGGDIPEYAYLVIAAAIRLSRREEIEYAQSTAAWARRDLRKAGTDLPAQQRKPPKKH